MDFTTILYDNFVVLVMVACLVVGYIVKHATFFKWIKNDDIPVILAIVGLLINLYVSGLSAASAVYGALMGLASTGFHQAFSEFIDNKNINKEKE